MNLRLIIKLASIGLSVASVGIITSSIMMNSYGEYKENYDAVMAEKENKKFEEIDGVTVKKVFLRVINNKPSYVITGNYDEEVNPETLSFKLNTYENRANFAEVVHKQYNLEDKSFAMYTDISYISADGNGNTNYNNDSAAVTLEDSLEWHAYYPKLVIGEKEVDLINTQSIWDGATLEFNNCTYKIKHNKDTSALPILVKTTEQVVSETAYYTATGVEMAQYDNDVFYILHGVSEGYNRDTLSRDLAFELRAGISNGTIFAIRGTQGGHVIMEENGNFKLYVRLNDVPATSNPYYTRFGPYDESVSHIPDLKVPGVNGTVNQTSIIKGNKKYTMYINHGTNAAGAYGTSGVKITEIA